MYSAQNKTLDPLSPTQQQKGGQTMKKLILTGIIMAVALLMAGLPCTSAADYSFKLGVVTPTDHPHSISSREFAKLVEERSGGRVKISIFDSGKLGSNPELLDGVKTGVIDICVNTPGVMAAYYPVTGLLELPYLFTSKEHMMKVTRGPIRIVCFCGNLNTYRANVLFG
jgi:TRAP-type C4-dicarboxylate transport system substrate-binding protein